MIIVTFSRTTEIVNDYDLAPSRQEDVGAHNLNISGMNENSDAAPEIPQATAATPSSFSLALSSWLISVHRTGQINAGL